MFKKQLGSNASKEKVISKLQRENAIISKGYIKISYIFCQKDECETYKEQKHVYINQTAYYDDDYKVYILEKNRAGQYPSELRRRVPKAIINYNNTCRYTGYVIYNRHECQKK